MKTGPPNEPPAATAEEREQLKDPIWLFDSFVGNSEDLLTVVDERGRFLWVNSASERVFGVAPEACVGQSAFEFIHPEDREKTEAAFEGWTRRQTDDSFTFENRQVARGGEVCHVLWTVRAQRNANGELIGFASSAKNITDRKLFEAALESSETRHRALLASVLDPTITIDAFGSIQAASDSVRPVLGYAPQELVGQNIKILLPEPHRSEHDNYLANYRRTGETNILGQTREFEVVRKDGECIVCELSIARADIPGEQDPLFTGSFRNITERKHAEEALRESERRFHAIFDQEFQYVGLLDRDGLVLEINQSALDAGRMELADVRGQPFWKARWWAESPEQRSRVNEAVRRAAAGAFVRFEIRAKGRAGEARDIDFSIKPIRSEDGRVVLLLPEGRDITDLKRAQQAETNMLRSLATIGESAATLAHEIKNPITAVNTALRAVASHLGADDKEILEDLADRMKGLETKMRRTLTFARPLAVERTPSSAQELLDDVLEQLRLDIVRSGADVTSTVVPPGLSLHGSAEHLSDVMANLVRNALDAVGGGRVVLRATASPEGGALLTVDDDGPGIPASIQESLFRPFTTSKQNGTGLGLAICKKIIEAHEGRIESDRSPLGGARFSIYLPHESVT